MLGEQVKAGKKRSVTCSTYIGYTPEERAKIGKYAAKNRPARATRHFAVPETTVQRLKTKYLQKLKVVLHDSENATVIVKSLPTKPQGWPVAL